MHVKRGGEVMDAFLDPLGRGGNEWNIRYRERGMDLQLFADEKTEEPTPKHRQEARKKGQVARSHEVMVAISFICTLIILIFLLPGVVERIARFTRGTFLQQLRASGGEGQLLAFADGALKYFITIISPLLAVPFITTVLAGVAQTGLLFTGEAITPRLERINPLQGLQRILSKRALMEFVKAFLKISIIGAIAYYAIRGSIPSLVSLTVLPLGEAISMVGSILRSLGLRVGVVFLLIAALDYWYQRYEHESTLRMTKDEVKEEYKQVEGDPLIRQRLREAQRRIARQRMMSDVPTADVVITNPTHIAVALKYEAKKMNAPTVVAKGKGYLAERIKEVARENNVTIVENKPLAQSLYDQVEVGDEIPVELYKAVAEILAYVYRLKGRRL